MSELPGPVQRLADAAGLPREQAAAVWQDVCDGKPLVDETAARHALLEFQRRADAPDPVVVRYESERDRLEQAGLITLADAVLG